MSPSCLLTSFDVWEAHQRSNTSDDLLGELVRRDWLSPTTRLLRKLPVDFDQAPAQVIAAMESWRPEIVVCCGMAERRSRLAIESNGTIGSETIYTPVQVDELVQGLSHTDVSHDAGRFVCNHTYYTVLRYIQRTQLPTRCVFVHVPLLTMANQEAIAIEFAQILTRLQTSHESQTALNPGTLA